jgi:hypothetical protein
MIKSITNRALTALFTVGLAAITPILEGCPKQKPTTTIPEATIDYTICQEPIVPLNYSANLRANEYVVPNAVFAAYQRINNTKPGYIKPITTSEVASFSETLQQQANGCSPDQAATYADLFSTQRSLVVPESTLQLPEQEFVDLLRYQRLLNELDGLEYDASVPLEVAFKELAPTYANRKNSPFENDPNPTNYDLIRFVSSQQYAAEKDLIDGRGNSLSFSNVVLEDLKFNTNLNYPGNTEALEALSQCLYAIE